MSATRGGTPQSKVVVVMGVGWIDRIYNNTGLEWQMQSIDSRNNGAIRSWPENKQLFDLHDQKFHILSPAAEFRGDWCGIPWYYNGKHYKSLTADQEHFVQIFTSHVEGRNWIYFVDGKTGRDIGRQTAPDVDFHCYLRFEDSGIFIDIKNDDGTTADVLAFLYDETKYWVQVAISIFGGSVKKAAGGG